MTTALIAMIIIGLLAYGLERNRRHQNQPGSRFAGSTDVIDRDFERISADLRARS
jgi:hypothetical protein